MIDPKLRAELWSAINDYAVACGGSPGVIGSRPTRREEAVAEVEKIVEEMLEPLRPRYPWKGELPEDLQEVVVQWRDSLTKAKDAQTYRERNREWWTVDAVAWWTYPTIPTPAEE